MTVREEIERKYPSLVANWKRGSRKAAIRLFCLECMGGNRGDVSRCTSTGCALHAFRGAGAPSQVGVSASKTGQTDSEAPG